MKIGLFDPYLDTMGGGERYILSIASFLQKNHEVILYWDDTSIKEKAKVKFLLNLNGVTIRPNIFGRKTSFVSRLKQTVGLDYFFYVSDGSIPTVASRQVIPIIQFPIEGIDARNFRSRLRLVNTKMILCYSEFVKKFLEKSYPVPVKVLWPAVPTIQPVSKKENIILSVGRFTRGNNTKNQEMLLRFFKGLYTNHFKNWKLILAGSYLPEDEDFVTSLKKLIEKAPVEIHANCNFAELSRLYARSRIYWHAAGFGKDIEKHPRYAEHFGISVVEAMSVGSVPVVFSGGGLTEIVTDGENGYLWKNENELFEKTQKIMQNSWEYEKLSKNAQKRAVDFDTQAFNRKLSEFIR